MKTLMFITDSLGLPRFFPEEVLEEDVWVMKVCNEMASLYPDQFHFERFSRRGLNSRMIQKLVRGVVAKNGVPDIMILQVGIVDSCPRALRKIELSIISRIPIINKVVKRIIKRNYAKITSARKIVYVPIGEFHERMVCLRNYFKGANIFVIPIAPVNDSFATKSPRISMNVKMYNECLADVFGSSYRATAYDGADISKLFLSDDHHLSRYGNDYLAKGVTRDLCNEVF